MKVEMIPLSQIEAPEEPVRNIKLGTMEEIRDSIEADELYHPLTVRPLENGRFEVVAGYHRYVALKTLGRKEIPCIVRNLSAEEGYLVSVAENIQRNTHLDPIKEGEIFTELQEKGWTVAAIARKIGKQKNPVYVSDRIRVYERLHPKLQTKVSKGRLSWQNAKALAEHDERTQLEIAEKIRRWPSINPNSISTLIGRIQTGCTHGCPSHCPPIVDL